MVYGTITNNSNGMPIKGMKVGLYSKKEDNHNVKKGIYQDTDSTDVNGNYTLEVQGKHIEYVFLRAYSPSNFVETPDQFLQNGSTNKVDYALNPYDAYLRLTLQHDSISASRIYYYFSGQYYDKAEYVALEGQFLPIGMSKTILYKVPGGQVININWDTKEINFPLNPFPHTTTVECPRNVTTDFVLKY